MTGTLRKFSGGDVSRMYILRARFVNSSYIWVCSSAISILIQLIFCVRDSLIFEYNSSFNSATIQVHNHTKRTGRMLSVSQNILFVIISFRFLRLGNKGNIASFMRGRLNNVMTLFHITLFHVIKYHDLELKLIKLLISLGPWSAAPLASIYSSQ